MPAVDQTCVTEQTQRWCLLVVYILNQGLWDLTLSDTITSNNPSQSLLTAPAVPFVAVSSLRQYISVWDSPASHCISRHNRFHGHHTMTSASAAKKRNLSSAQSGLCSAMCATCMCDSIQAHNKPDEIQGCWLNLFKGTGSARRSFLVDLCPGDVELFVYMILWVWKG